MALPRSLVGHQLQIALMMAASALASGCGIHRLLDDGEVRVNRWGDGRIYAEMDIETVRKMGGPTNPLVRQAISIEARKKGICSINVGITETILTRGHYEFFVTCN